MSTSKTTEIMADKKPVKVLVAKYTIKVQSVWIVPDNFNMDKPHIKWDRLDVSAEKVRDATDMLDQETSGGLKYPDEVILCEYDNKELIENDVWYDCDDYDEEIVEKVRAEING